MCVFIKAHPSKHQADLKKSKGMVTEEGKGMVTEECIPNESYGN